MNDGVTKRYRRSALLLTWCWLLFGSIFAEAKTIQFGGYSWWVRTGYGESGPNNWSENNVYVDSGGDLHLKLTHDTTTGKWYCAELTMLESLGFGTYSFALKSNPYLLDKNIVLGLFSYPEESVAPDTTNEIDIEYAMWGGGQTLHGNWTIWPTSLGHTESEEYFDGSQSGAASIQQYIWTSTSITFSATNVEGSQPKTYASWKFQPSDPLQSISQITMPVEMNLWLYESKPPSDGKEVDIVVSGFTYTPIADKTSPSVPTNVIATATSGTQVSLSWGASVDDNGVAGYTVYRNGSVVGRATGTTYQDSGLNPGASYSYTIAAQDAAGNLSGPSQAVNVTLPLIADTTPPSVPRNLKASSKPVILRWSASRDNVGVAGYNIYRSGVVIGHSAGTTFTDSTVTSGRTYKYAISAFDAAGNESAKSSPFTFYIR